MREFATLGKRKAVLGMIHLQPLPGTLFYKDSSFNQTLDTAVQSARALYDGGADGCLVQTVDRIYSVKDESDPARTIAMGLPAISIVTNEPGSRSFSVWQTHCQVFEMIWFKSTWNHMGSM